MYATKSMVSHVANFDINKVPNGPGNNLTHTNISESTLVDNTIKQDGTTSKGDRAANRDRLTKHFKHRKTDDFVRARAIQKMEPVAQQFRNDQFRDERDCALNRNFLPTARV